MNKKYIHPNVIPFVSGLSLWAYSVWFLMDWKESIISAIVLYLYGYSISYGSKEYIIFNTTTRRNETKAVILFCGFILLATTFNIAVRFFK